jgi:hypothetical protein
MTNQDLLAKALVLISQYHIALLEYRPAAHIIEPLIRDLSELRKLATQEKLNS